MSPSLSLQLLCSGGVHLYGQTDSRHLLGGENLLREGSGGSCEATGQSEAGPGSEDGQSCACCEDSEDTSSQGQSSCQDTFSHGI